MVKSTAGLSISLITDYDWSILLISSGDEGGLLNHVFMLTASTYSRCTLNILPRDQSDDHHRKIPSSVQFTTSPSVYVEIAMFSGIWFGESVQLIIGIFCIVWHERTRALWSQSNASTLQVVPQHQIEERSFFFESGIILTFLSIGSWVDYLSPNQHILAVAVVHLLLYYPQN